MKDIELFRKDAFCVIGKAGSTDDGPDFVRRLWEDANNHFSEVEHLAKRDEKGRLMGVWGIMTNFSFEFLPWEDNFSKGYTWLGWKWKRMPWLLRAGRNGSFPAWNIGR